MKDKIVTPNTQHTDQTTATTPLLPDKIRRGPYHRMVEIRKQIFDGKFPNKPALAKEFEVSIKTIGNDIDFMRTHWKLPIEFDFEKNGYYYSSPVSAAPEGVLSPGELASLCTMCHLIDRFPGAVLKQPLGKMREKLINLLTEEDRANLQVLMDRVQFRPYGEVPVDPQAFELVTTALRKERILQWEYRKPEGDFELRRVRPYRMFHWVGCWYVIGFDELRQDIRIFALHRMRNGQMIPEKYTIPKDFDLDKHLWHSLGIRRGKGDYEVIIELDPYLAGTLERREWHHSQVWTELPDGGALLSMRLSCLEEIEYCVLSWGTHATVLQPPELRRRIRIVALELVERYAADESREQGAKSMEPAPGN